MLLERTTVKYLLYKHQRDKSKRLHHRRVRLIEAFTIKPDKINFKFQRISENTGKNCVMRKFLFCEI